MENKRFIIKLITILLFISIIIDIIYDESFYMLYRDSEILNYAGSIEASTQKLVKQELMGIDNDELIDEIYGIISSLKEYNKRKIFLLAKEQKFTDKLSNIELSFGNLVQEIYRYRQSKDPQKLYELSEDFFNKSNDFVNYVQEYSEDKVIILRYMGHLLYLSIIALILVDLYQNYSIRRLKRNKYKMEQLAYYDSLTRLPNRTYLDQVLAKYKKTKPLPTLACIFFDLNNLKTTNDSLGHNTGDKVLQDFSHIIREISKDYGIIARNGGDEFVGIFENCTEQDIEGFKKSLYREIERYNQEEVEVKLSVAMGVSYSRVDANTIEELITIADQRMYKDKKSHAAKLSSIA